MHQYLMMGSDVTVSELKQIKLRRERSPSGTNNESRKGERNLTNAENLGLHSMPSQVSLSVFTAGVRC